MATAHTAKECPVKVMVHFLLTQTLAVQSQDPEIIVPNLTKKQMLFKKEIIAANLLAHKETCHILCMAIHLE